MPVTRMPSCLVSRVLVVAAVAATAASAACGDECCPADLTSDALVDAADLGVLLGNWGLDPSLGAGDLDGSGSIDGLDLAVLIGAWGACAVGPTWVVPDVGAVVLGGTQPSIDATILFDDGSGPALYVGGRFTSIAGVPANNIAKWDGDEWLPLGLGVAGTASVGVTQVLTFAAFDDSTGDALYVGGNFATAGGLPSSAIARWKAGAWQPFTAGLNGTVEALCVFDAPTGGGPRLHAGGIFTQGLDGISVPLNRIGKWNGGFWEALQTGVTGQVFQPGVSALQVYDDGDGPALFVGGWFTQAGLVPTNSLAKWTGANWVAVGNLTSFGFVQVFDLARLETDGGNGSLVVAGWFKSAGGVDAKGIARYDGRAWDSLDGGFAADLSVEHVEVVDYGLAPGRVLYAADGAAVWRYTDGAWAPLGLAATGANSYVGSLGRYDLGGFVTLLVGGRFQSSASGRGSIAEFGCE